MPHSTLRAASAFVASLVAKNGDMTFAPTATLGIRGTTGVVDVPDNTAGGAGEPKSGTRMPMGEYR